MPFSLPGISGRARRSAGTTRRSGALRGAAANRGRRWRFKLPVIPPDALFNLRFLGVLSAACGAFTLVALASPTGAVTQAWAGQARAVTGWAAPLWSAVLVAGGVALYFKRRALRRAVGGRLAGAALLLLAAAAMHQLITDPPPPGASPAGVLAGLPGQDGYVGLVFGAALAAWFGAPGAALLLLPVAGLGFGLLCGWSWVAWQRLGRRAAAGARSAGRFGYRVAGATHWTLRRVARLTAATARATVRGAIITARLLEAQARQWQQAIAARLAAREAARHPAPLAIAAPAAPLPEPHDLPLEADSATGITLAMARAAPPQPARPRHKAGSPDVKWQLPSTAILAPTTSEEISEAEIAEKRRLIERTLGAFNVPVTVTDAKIGPRVTQFLLRPAEGVSVKRIKAFEADLQLVLAAQTLRIELPVPGRPNVGIETPNSGIATVGLREMLESYHFRDSKGKLRIALGRDVDGNPRVGDLTKMPHLLIAGQTGSGKSFCINSIITSLLFQCTPEELHLLMIDPKMVELAQYEDIPHLRYPVVVDLAEAGKVLLWAVEEMERRYRLMRDAGYRNIDSYNKAAATNPRPDDVPPEALPLKPFPYMVIIIDELADLMMFAPDDVEPAICRLTAKARAVGIHLVVATQRPSVDVVTGLIKANMPSRIAFAVSSQIDSRVVLDMGGAESLLGRGDMLYLPYDQGRPVRAQGTYVSDDDIAKLVHFWKRQGSPQYVEKEEIEALTLKQESADGEKGGDKQSSLLERAMALLSNTNYVSVSYLQRKLAVGYPRAARLLDELEERGLIEPDESAGRSTYRVLQDALPAEAGMGDVDLDEERLSRLS
ncbi:MAG TPA: DNA translocase FtsK 4TM domain-containing protein [Chloroflexota bacterium]|nr:DNA translocase FtsK 4TM domain-containing protein [Chloroflexota bacterium]